MNARRLGFLLPALLAWTPAAPGAAHFYTQDLLLPPNGICAMPGQRLAVFPNGIVVSNWGMLRYSQSIPPPPVVGTPVILTFNATTEMEVSYDGGFTWTPVTLDAAVQMQWQYTGSAGGVNVYQTELLRMDLAGGGLPPGIFFRESPTLGSVGQTRIQPVAGGFMIESFFDIFTEVSTDGGATWLPAALPGRAELTPDPRWIPAVVAPTALFPPPEKQWASTAAMWQAYPPGTAIRGLSARLAGNWIPLPLPGGTNVVAFPLVADLQLDLFGTGTFSPARVPGVMAVRMIHARAFGGRDTYTLEPLQLDLAGGDLPAGVMIRESPVRASEGGLSLTADPDGFPISSFFDVFTELSTDGGGSWSPAANGPGRLELQIIAPAHDYPVPDHPPYAGRYRGIPAIFAQFNPGIVVSNVAFRNFTQSFPLPPAGVTQTVTFGATADLWASTDGGATFDPMSAPVTMTARLIPRPVVAGTTEFYDTEMLSLDLIGGGLPGGVMVRESPTRRSPGRLAATAEPMGTYQVESFFDVFLELSTDGGQTWVPAATGPGTLVLEPRDVPLSQVDAFDWCIADVMLDIPGHPPETVHLCGTGRVQAIVGFNGAATDTDGNGREQIATRLVHLGMRGTCSVGQVYTSLRLGTNALGEVEETANMTPGILDVRPYVPAGLADSFFDIFFDVTVSNQPLHTSRPAHAVARLSSWPPDWEEAYTNLAPIVDLLTTNDTLSGLRMRLERWIPNPRRPVAKIALMPDYRMLIAWTNRACCFVADRVPALAPPTNPWTFFGQPAPTGTTGDIGVRFDPTNGFFRLRFVP